MSEKQYVINVEDGISTVELVEKSEVEIQSTYTIMMPLIDKDDKINEIILKPS